MIQETRYEKIKAYIKEWAGIKTALEVSVEMGVGQSYILQTAAKMGISMKLKSVEEKRQKIDEVLKEKGRDLTVPEIARLIDVPMASVRNRAAHLGIEIKRINRVRKNIIHREGIFNYSERSNWLI